MIYSKTGTNNTSIGVLVHIHSGNLRYLLGTGGVEGAIISTRVLSKIIVNKASPQVPAGTSLERGTGARGAYINIKFSTSIQDAARRTQIASS
jgi:hypothetical protein